MNPVRIRIYSRKGCHLCEEAKTILMKYSQRYPISIEEVDIETDPEAMKKFQFEIPVIFVEKDKLFKYRIHEQKLRKAIESRMRRREATPSEQ